MTARRHLECSGPNCRAPYLMAEMDPTDRQPVPRNHPVNPDSIGVRGTLALRQGTGGLWFGRYLTRARPLEPGEQLAESHYSTCPDAGRFRRQR